MVEVLEWKMKLWHFIFWDWQAKLGFYRDYYDGWHWSLNLKLFSLGYGPYMKACDVQRCEDCIHNGQICAVVKFGECASYRRKWWKFWRSK